MNYVKENLPLTNKQINFESQLHPVISKIIYYVLNGWPNSKLNSIISPFYIRRNELSVEHGILMWGYKVTIPKKFQTTVLEEIHSSHMGIVRMKSLARSYVWWPSINKDIENFVANCNSCASYRQSPEIAELKHGPWEEQPWTRVHIDFFGPLFSYNFFVIIDSTTKWIECFPMHNITSELTIKKLREIFGRFGLPKYIVSDNGTRVSAIRRT